MYICSVVVAKEKIHAISWIRLFIIIITKNQTLSIPNHVLIAYLQQIHPIVNMIGAQNCIIERVINFVMDVLSQNKQNQLFPYHC